MALSIYPLEQRCLAQLVYGFEDEDRPAQYTNPLRLRTDAGFVSLGGPGRDLLQARIKGWQDAFLSPLPPVLAMVERPDRTEILDTRSIAPEPKAILEGVEHRSHRACWAAGSLSTLVKSVSEDGGGAVASQEVSHALASLVSRKLVAKLGDRYLALAIPGDIPSLPRSHREGYPGGWVRRPQKLRQAAPAQKIGSAARSGVLNVAHFREPLALDCGRTLPTFDLAYECYGKLAPGAENAVLVCHPLTKDAHAAGRGVNGKLGWWDAAIGPGRLLDTDKYFVICSGALGGASGSSGPASNDPETGRPYAMKFPVVTVHDMVRAQRRLTELLGVRRLFGVIGGCLGGQQALQWCIDFPGAVDNAVIISATPAASAHTIAIFDVMRRLIQSDEDWNDGNYYGGAFPTKGMANALTAAVPLWMSREAMEHRFGRKLRGAAEYSYSFEPEFEVERYVADVAGRAGRDIDPNTLLYLMRAMQYFDVAKSGETLEKALSQVRARMLLLSYASDWRYPPQEMDRLQHAFEARGADSRHIVLESVYGHGAFLHDMAGCETAIRQFLAQSGATARLMGDAERCYA